MLNYLTLIFSCQLVGELVTRAVAIPLPGPVFGMMLLFALLLIKGSVPEKLAVTADGLLSHLSLLFVPAGVGVMLHFSLFGDDWLVISIALVASTVLTIVVTGLMMSWLSKHSPSADNIGMKD
ncbi:MAG: CidA/LrgA family protein [Pseudomonadota bacterium]